MDSGESRLKGVVSDLGLERNEEHFRSFNLKVGIVVKAEKSLSYEDGERLMRQLRKELLGKEVEIASIIFRCSKCGKEFKNEQGLKRHTRVTHEANSAKKKPLKTTKEDIKKKVEKKVGKRNKSTPASKSSPRKK